MRTPTLQSTASATISARRNRRSAAARLAGLLVVLALSGLRASGATILWTNTLGGNWSATNNWSPNQVPGGSDEAVLTNATLAVTADGAEVLRTLLPK